jgi:hypothetical protein
MPVQRLRMGAMDIHEKRAELRSAVNRATVSALWPEAAIEYAAR